MFRLLSIALGLANASNLDQPGFGGSLTQAGFTEAKNIAVPFIFQNLKKLNVPEIDFDGGNLKNGVLQIPMPALKDIQLDIQHDNNGVDLVANNVQAQMTADFSYKYFFTVTGKVNVNIKKLGIDFDLGVGEQAGTNPSYEMVPKLTVNTLNVDLNPNDIDVTLSGSLVAKIASVFIPMFKNTIIPGMITQLETTIKSTIEDKGNEDFKKYGTQEAIPYLAGVTFDYAMTGAGPTVTTDDVFTIGFNGTFFDQKDLQPTKYTKAKFQLRDPKSKELQAYLTDFTINTALESGFQTGNELDITYLLQTYLNYTVNTDLIGVVIPEILTKYGSGKAVSISGKFTQSPSVTHFTPSGQTAEGNLLVKLSVANEVAIQAEFQGISAGASIHSQNGKVFGKISKATLGAINQANFQTTLGFTSAQLLKELQDPVDQYVQIANTQLVDGLVIPTIFGINVSNFEVNFFDGYLQAGLSATSALFEQVRDRFMPKLSAAMQFTEFEMQAEPVKDDYAIAREMVLRSLHFGRI